MRMRKESRRQGRILGWILNGLNPLIESGYYGPYNLNISPEYYYMLISTLNPMTHITLMERLRSMIDRCGDKIFSGITVDENMDCGFKIMKEGNKE